MATINPNAAEVEDAVEPPIQCVPTISFHSTASAGARAARGSNHPLPNSPQSRARKVLIQQDIPRPQWEGVRGRGIRVVDFRL